MLRFIAYIFISLFFFTLLTVAVLAGGLYYLVVVEPGPEIEESYINEILGRESPVLYRDGETRLGVLFEGIHRQYISFDQIPESFVHAMIASEDDRFFQHFGVDIFGITRAAIANLRAGRIVQGGSTITQQTAKNLFKRESRSFREKLKELLFALRLEHRYSKEKIFEFYSNQFFVSGNGHGLGVAARYYFDKQPDELTLLECAFIAGSVQRPNFYNPFLRRNVENSEQVRARIERRVRYVLGQMRKAGTISEEEYAAINLDELVFTQGRTTFSHNTGMDLVKEGLEARFIVDILERNGISNISTSGARIITTLDRDVQEKTVLALRKHLSLLDVRLRGYQRDKVQAEYGELDYHGDRDLLPGAFVFGTVEEVTDTRDSGLQVRVSFHRGQAEGIIDDKGIERLVEAVAKYKRNAWTTPGAADRRELIGALQPEDRVYVHIRSVNDQGEMLLDLERYPQVEGAALVLQQGAIRAMSGGMANIYFNRATSAKRLMGSAVKPFLYGAALQLGWSPVDMLRNQRDVFIFMNRPYFPQPIHDSPFEAVSMSWAGVTSENLATVWLLYHLTDHLTPPRLRDLAARLDMAPREIGGRTEGYQQYMERIRDDFGIVLTRDVLEEAAFASAVRMLKADFLFDNRTAEYAKLERLKYGLHFERFAADILSGRDGGARADRDRDVSLFQPNYLQLRSVLNRFHTYRQHVEDWSMPADPDRVFNNQPIASPAGRMVRDTAGGFIFTLKPTLPPNWIPIAPGDVRGYLAFLSPGQIEAFWRQVSIEGVLTAATLDLVEDQIRSEQTRFLVARPYTLDILGEVRDFRLMLGLQYLIHLARECGVNSPFEPVLSLPLGSNVVTLAEITRMYETLVTGKRHDSIDAATLAVMALEGPVDQDGAAIIERIETPEGRVVYSRQVHQTAVFDPKSSAVLAHILENAVSHGTGRYARDTVRLHSRDAARQKSLDALNLPVPLLGKTGTANRYRNAAFVGYVPVPAKESHSLLALEDGYTVGVYTGYDFNHPMVRTGTRITGSQGALPVWSDIAQALVDMEELGERLDMVDLTFNGLSLQYPGMEQVFIPAAPQQGGAAIPAGQLFRQDVPPAGPSILGFGSLGESGHFEPERWFQPYWKNR
ncbi:transglycosylase domain-containing protein [Desulfobulbus alkaliphilus]|uniref:transglycosylase domain-containing protein n=1 Tax=Desulfobulbus alkaliphilus TaxID=869814 RepID=UPI001964B315|nr:transglycosylase domain-containing protein [Desulfobulbus alkaliphilus]MBM9538008.1 transglycosylase domain-containing protein [Desulfobulbus alkaliphilus]